ncbi:MAG: uroporphyrinogen-III C-methyltransferase [Cyclobacteriaceae bacterium]|nr:uroporphyrinogen-III C-methyltransferase [Cyclobacteriaceae bacterium]
MNQSGNPALTLVGAGPGDPDLITVKGLKKLADADVVLYDALINVELLKYAPADSLKIFVGKRSGTHCFTQDEINRMIVFYARERGHVVRLKGGDPYVFGRGFEEYSFAVKHQIPVEVVPGISSATGLSAAMDVPVTMRGISESFWVVTGTTRDGVFSKDLKIAAHSTATVIILMGMKKLSRIVQTYRSVNKENYPVMIIQNGTLSDEKCVTGTISTIESLVREQNLSSPAVIIVGEVIERTCGYIRKNKSLLYDAVFTGYKRGARAKGNFSKVSTRI